VTRPQRARVARWQAAAEVLAHLRGRPGITRADLARELGLTTGSATEIAARLRDGALVAETPAPSQGRGRPSLVLGPHPRGPVVLVLDIRQSELRSAVATVDGVLHSVESQRHRSRNARSVLAAARIVVERASRVYGPRLRTVSVAAAATIQHAHVVQASTLDWGSVDLGPLTADTGLDLLVGNDATLAGVAEARTGAATGAGTALHLIVETGIGGSLTVDGRPLAGAGGSAGEFGHQPYGDRRLLCPCGARGCWDLEVDGRALARQLRQAPPADPRAYAISVLSRADAAAVKAVSTVVTSLAAGIAGLVNAHDPEIVTLGGLAVPLRAAAPGRFDTAYTQGLMTFRRAQPPPVLDATHHDDGALRGAALLGLDHVTSQEALAAWAAL
jgi:predicted NBD/HSP70 family sugar kinase